MSFSVSRQVEACSNCCHLNVSFAPTGCPRPTASTRVQENYEESTLRKKALEDELEDLEGKLLRAEKLLSGEPRHLDANVTCITHQSAMHLPG